MKFDMIALRMATVSVFDDDVYREAWTMTYLQELSSFSSEK